jgi:2',3'-cyclic-nucleotide 2'-phosphodiesterase (5'-nucleotidase family)
MWILLAVTLAAPTVRGTRVTEGRLDDRLATGPADLVLLYGGEQRGSQADCGCPHDPRGSLGRVEAYASAVEASGVPTLLLNPGNWLNDPTGQGNRLRDDAMVQNAHMVDAVRAGSWDALNVTFRDLPYLARADVWPTGIVSASARGAPALPPYVLLEAGARTVAVTGVTPWSKTYLQPADVERLPPVEALEAILPRMHAEADLVVVMTYGLGRDVRAVAQLDIDVLIEADHLRNRFEPVLFGNTVWVRSFDQTQVLGELRLEWGDEGLDRVVARTIDLDGDIPRRGPWRRREKRAHKAVRSAQERLFGR